MGIKANGLMSDGTINPSTEFLINCIGKYSGSEFSNSFYPSFFLGVLSPAFGVSSALPASGF